MTRRALTHDDVSTALERIEKLPHRRNRLLKVGGKNRNEFTLGGGQPGANRGERSEVSTQQTICDGNGISGNRA